jgi:hypothetical protein
VIKYWDAQTATHELSHNFGARDLYLTAGGRYHHDGALMSFFNRGLAESTDQVAWAELGLGDLDGDREIDVLAFSRAPQRLVLERVEVSAYPNSANLSFQARLVGQEGSRHLRIAPHAVTIELPEHGVQIDFVGLRDRMSDEDLFLGYLRAPQDLSQETFDAIVAAGRAEVRVVASHFHTTEAFERVRLDLDETQDLAIAVKTGGNNPGPIPPGGLLPDHHVRACVPLE